jgi:alanine racemase
VGDEVTLIGRDGAGEVALGEMAELCDTIPYEILCGFNDRLPRIYLP